MTLRVTTAQPRTTLLTVMAARVAAKRRVSLTTAGHVAGRLALIAGHDYTDCVTVAGTTTSDAIDTDALLAICRVHPDGTTQASRLGGSHVRFDAVKVRTLATAQVDVATVSR